MLETCAMLACSSDKLVLLNILRETGHFDTDINHPNTKGTRKIFFKQCETQMNKKFLIFLLEIYLVA